MTCLKKNIFILLFLSSFTATAENNSELYAEDFLLLYQDEEMISIATGSAKPIHLAPSVASVITAREIKALGARTLDEALEFVPGLHVSRDQYSQSAIYSIRGIHSNFNPQVVVLINGHPINEPISGSRPSQFKLPVANISRIEVIRGPGSAVHGADAFAGVINVITKSADELSGSIAGARAGSFGQRDIWLQHGGEFADWKSAFSFEYSTTDSDNNRYIESDFSGNTGNMNTQYELYNTSFNLKKGRWNLWLNSWNQRDGRLGIGVTQVFDPNGYQTNDMYTGKLNYEDKNFTKDWQLSTTLAYRRLEQNSYYWLYPPGSVIPMDSQGNIFIPGSVFGGYANFIDGMRGNPGGKLDHSSFESAFSYHGQRNHLIRFAFGVKHERVSVWENKNFGPGVLDGTTLNNNENDPTPVTGTLTSVTGTPNIFLPNSSRTVRHISFQDEWKFARDWELTTGIRYDHYSDFGSTTNPRIALVWATRYNLTSKLLYGRAFRAPGFGELYYVNNPATIGNPDLTPEVLDMLELAFDYQPTFDLDLALNLFQYQARDLIAYGADGVAQNAHDQRGYGMEMEFNYIASKQLTLLGNFSWQRSKDRESSEPVADAPGYQASLALRMRTTDRCNLNAQANWVAGRQRALSDGRAPIDDYMAIDFTARCNYLFKQPLEIAASIRNALNNDIREPSPYNPIAGSAGVANDYPQEGRSLYVELSYTFK
ncbi:MAG: TonB-dependent receptor [Gammaproteobacteria bacterium]|nr:TonB-dependent receptor [Gammaproteobacteria bacterium]